MRDSPTTQGISRLVQDMSCQLSFALAVHVRHHHVDSCQLTGGMYVGAYLVYFGCLKRKRKEGITR